MTYAKYGTVQALDYSTGLVGNATSSTANLFNTTWAIGTGTTGYGQTALAQVGTGELVGNTAWSNLINKIANVASHQGTTGFTVITAPSVGNIISFLTPLQTNLQLIYAQRLNAALQGGTSSNTVTTTQTWTDNAVWTHTITFANGNAARYFFNSGGQITMSCTHPSGTGIDNLFNNLATSTGNVVMSSTTTGTVNISGNSFNGITQVPATGYSNITLYSNFGYYGLPTSNSEIFKQTAATFSGGPVDYLNSYINYKVKSNGPQGSNGDAGSVITIYTTFDEVSSLAGLTVSSGSTVTCTVQFPETTYIANTWGTVNISGTVTVA